EVGVDLGVAAHPGAASTVAAEHEMGEFAFDLGSGRPVVIPPPWTLLAGAGLGQVFLVTADADGAALGVGGALGAQRAVGAGVAELGDPVAGPVAADRDGDPVGARHRVVLGVHIE